MILTLAALILQFPAIPQKMNLRNFSGTGEDIATTAPETAPKTEVGAPDANPASAPGVPAADALILNSGLPARDSIAAALSLSPVLGSQNGSGNRQHREWLTLMIAQHSAATFDAWSTRQAISTGRYRELNPALRPFAENASLYAAIQFCPLALDYLGRRMMTSRYGWVRHTWWIPQAASTAISFGSSVHNLSLH